MKNGSSAFYLIGVLLLILTYFAFASMRSEEDAAGRANNLSGLVSSMRIASQATVDATQGSSDASEHPLDPLLEIARDIKRNIENNVQDYTANLVKRERIKGRLGSESRMFLKVRNSSQSPGNSIPFATYMKFTYPSSAKGREVIWVEGENDNRLISHEGGLLNLKRFNLEPDGMLAMMGNKYPITEIGLLRLVEKLIEKGERDKAIGTCVVETIEDQIVGDRICRLFQVIHPEPVNGFDFHIAQVFVDVERNIPLRYAAYLWPKSGEEPPLEEEYTYLDVKLNVGLTSADFDPDNPNYNYP